MSRFITVFGACLIFASSIHAADASHLASAQPLHYAFAASSAMQAGSADGLAAKVKAKLDAEPALKGAVTVSASGDNVTLEGEVSSVVDRAKAGELALGTDGVKKVNNKLKLKK